MAASCLSTVPVVHPPPPSCQPCQHRVQGGSGEGRDSVPDKFVTFLPSGSQRISGKLLFSPPTHYPDSFPRRESERGCREVAGVSQAPSAAPDLGAESKGMCSQSLPWPAQRPDLSLDMTLT